MEQHKNLGKSILTYLVLAIGAILMVYPFYWMITGSLKSGREIMQFPPTFWPTTIHWENYKTAFEVAPFAQYFVNSVIVTISCVALSMITAILAAFAFSRLQFKGRDLLFTLLLSLMMVPFEMLVITNYRTIVKIGLIDTIPALIIPFTSSIFYTYILRNFFATIPDSLYQSARIDGASNWQYLWKVMVPMAKPSIVTIVLLNSISSWNAFLWPMLITNSAKTRTLPFGLYVFMSEAGSKNELLMAAATIVIAPMIILFLFARKSIVSGVARGGLKG